MSTTTPAAETRTATENSTTTPAGRTDPWADSTTDAPTDASVAAPRTFDPFCTRRLRNCIDGENAAFPDRN
jgi:hypothetical protein